MRDSIQAAVRKSLPQYRHLMASAWMSSAQKGHFFFPAVADGVAPAGLDVAAGSASASAPSSKWCSFAHFATSSPAVRYFCQEPSLIVAFLALSASSSCALTFGPTATTSQPIGPIKAPKT